MYISNISVEFLRYASFFLVLLIVKVLAYNRKCLSVFILLTLINAMASNVKRVKNK